MNERTRPKPRHPFWNRCLTPVRWIDGHILKPVFYMAIAMTGFILEWLVALPFVIALYLADFRRRR